MKRVILPCVAMSCVFAFTCLADVKWPTATTCQSGNLASEGSDGWGRSLPVAEDITFAGGGTYTVYLDNQALALATNVQTAVEPKSYGECWIMPYANKTPLHATIDIRHQAELTFRDFYIGRNATDNPMDDATMDVVVRDGSALHTLGSLCLCGGVSALTVTNNSTLTTDGKFCIHGVAVAKSSKWGPIWGRLTVRDSTWTVNGEAGIGSDSCPDEMRDSADIAAELTDSTVDLNSRFFAFGSKVVFKDCHVDGRKADGSTWAANSPNFNLGNDAEVVFDGGTYENLSICPGYGTRNSTIRIKDGTVTLSGMWLSPTPGVTALLEVDGETASLTYPNSSNDRIAYKGTATLSLKSGTVRASGGGYTRVGVGDSSNKAGVGYAKISGGTWILNAPHSPGGFYVGEHAEGHVEVSGGLLVGNFLEYASSLGNSDFRQTGGRIVLDASYGTTSATSATIRNAENGRLMMASKAAKAYLDGGVLEANGLQGAAVSELHANGGTVRVLPLPVEKTVYDPFIGGFGAAVVGAKGLTIDTDGHDANVTQAFADATDAPGEGRLVKAGEGTLMLAPTSYAVAKTVVEGGTLVPGVSSLATELVLTNGATFSLAGAATAVTLSALSVPNGRLELDPGDVITVTGAVELDGLQLSFTSEPSSATPFLVTEGELSESSHAALRRALYAAEPPEGQHGKFVPTYDAGTGKTTVTFEFADNIGELTEVTEWTGASSAWASDGNWRDGVPTASKKASFAGGSSVKTVETAAGAYAGAVTFGADGYSIGGTAPLEIAGEPNAAHIDVTVGTNAITAPLVLDSLTRVDLDAGTELRLSGEVKAGGLEKGGKGRLVLSNPQMDCPSGLALLGGTTVVACREALGTCAGVDPAVTMSADTLEVNAPNGQEIVFEQPVLLKGADDASAIILKSETPAVFKNMTRDLGAIIKRGKEKLSLEVRNGTTLIAGNGALQGNLTMNVAADQTLRFDADGSSPSTGYGALTVAEGELCVKPAVPGETPSVTAHGAILIGNRLYEGVSNPTLTIDHIDFDANYSWRTMVGLYINEADCVMREPTLRVVNGAKYYSDVTELGRFCNNGTMSVRPTLIVEDSTFKSWLLRPSYGTSSGGNTGVVRARNSTFEIGGEIDIAGNVDGDFDNCILGGYTAGSCLKLKNTSYGPGGSLRFRNGSVFRMNSIRFSPITRPLAFVFDSATWDFGTGDFTLCDTDTTQFASSGFFSLEMQGAGLTVAPSAGRTLTLDVPVVGEGGFVQAGEGSVVFGAGRYGFTGPLSVRAGIVDLSGAGVVTNAVLTAGAGTIQGGSFRNAEIRLAGVDAAVPHFKNVAFSGRSYLSVAGVTGACENIKVATYEGTVSLNGLFRVKGLDGYRAKLTAKDGEIRADIGQFGMCLIVR